MTYISKVLIIGDEDVGAEHVKTVLSARGFKVVGIEKTCDPAFQKIEESRPDLVIIGTTLNGRLDGFATAKEIKRNYNMPILFLSPQSEQFLLRRKKQVYPFGYILDTADVEQLLASVSTALRKNNTGKSGKWRLTNLIERILDRSRLEEKSRFKKKVDNEKEWPDRKDADMPANPEILSGEIESVDSLFEKIMQKGLEDEISLADIVLLNAKALVKPYIYNLKNSELNSKQNALLEGLEKNIEKVVSPFLYKLSERYFGLTPAELRISKLIKAGLTTKEIATQLDLSTSTINTHRDRIRKKLGIKGKKQNLRRFLERLE